MPSGVCDRLDLAHETIDISRAGSIMGRHAISQTVAEARSMPCKVGLSSNATVRLEIPRLRKRGDGPLFSVVQYHRQRALPLRLWLLGPAQARGWRFLVGPGLELFL